MLHYLKLSLVTGKNHVMFCTLDFSTFGGGKAYRGGKKCPRKTLSEKKSARKILPQSLFCLGKITVPSSCERGNIYTRAKHQKVLMVFCL